MPSHLYSGYGCYLMFTTNSATGNYSQPPLTYSISTPDAAV